MNRLGVFALGLLAALAPAPALDAERPLLVATTTSVRDSGLMDELLPAFTRETGIQVQLVAVGSGAALRMGEEGNADVLVTHEPEGETALVATGALLDRRPFMENYFVLVGPPEDPADAREAASAADAIARIAKAGAPFASRGDESGTHRREQALLRAAGLAPDASWAGLARTGSGMGPTLQIAGEKRAYVLSDEATFRAFRERTGLVALSKAEPALRNIYAVLRPNPERWPPGRVDVERARRFADFLVAAGTQSRIRAFGAAGGAPLFTPIAEAAPK